MSDNLKAILISGVILSILAGIIIYSTEAFSNKKTQADSRESSEVIIYTEDGQVVTPDNNPTVQNLSDNKPEVQNTDSSQVETLTNYTTPSVVESITSPTKSTPSEPTKPSIPTTQPQPTPQPVVNNGEFRDGAFPNVVIKYPTNWSLATSKSGSTTVLRFTTNAGISKIELRPYVSQQCDANTTAYELANSYPSNIYFVSEIFGNRIASLSQNCQPPKDGQLISTPNGLYDMVLYSENGTLEDFISKISFQK
jgi:hypothetical protein